jgi:type II secretory pathway pseudopilin PulG
MRRTGSLRGVGDEEGEHVSQHTRWWHLVDDEDGLGLIEVMMAVFILGVALLALASVGTSSLVSLRVTRDREQATNAASAAIEDARARDFSNLALAANSVVIAAIPPAAVPSGSTAGCFDGERVHTDAVVDPVPFERTAGNNDSITVHTLITFAESTCTGPATDLKRVIAIASWQDGTQTRFVRQETLVASAGRGLPVPKFEVRPPESSLSISKAHLSTSADARCIEHQLRNLGAEDRYDWEVEAVDDGLVGAGTGNSLRAGDWYATGYLEYPAVDSRAGEPPTEGEMTMAGGVPRPASDEIVEPGDTATFTVCYEPAFAVAPGADVWPKDVVATIAVRSRFDERQVRHLTHSVSVRDEAVPGTPLYLFDPDDSKAHPRGELRPNGTYRYFPFQMGHLASPTDDPSLVNHLGTIDYTKTSESNWSTEIGSNNYPGVRLQRPAVGSTNREVSPTTAVWHHQFLSPHILLPDATLVLWHAPLNALHSTGIPSGGQPVELEIRVDGLRSNENTVIWDGVTIPHTYNHTENDWARLEIPLTFGNEVLFTSGRYLRLRVTCAPSNSVDCNLAYDNVKYPAALYVQVK